MKHNLWQLIRNYQKSGGLQQSVSEQQFSNFPVFSLFVEKIISLCGTFDMFFRKGWQRAQKNYRDRKIEKQWKRGAKTEEEEKTQKTRNENREKQWKEKIRKSKSNQTEEKRKKENEK